MISSDSSGFGPADVRWRTAFWAAIVATPLFAFGFAALLPSYDLRQEIPEKTVLWSVVALVLITVLAWRWPRVSGIALGIAAPFVAVGVLMIIGYV